MNDVISWSAVLIISVIVGLLWVGCWVFVNNMTDNRLISIVLTAVNGVILLSAGAAFYLQYFR